MATRKVVRLLGGLTLLVGWARAQLVDDYNPPRSACCLAGSGQTLANQLQDWNQLGRYHAANLELMKQPVDLNRVVFMGDSITDGWKLAESFPGKPYVNRGIGGQTTAQMLVRMFPDVIDLKPAVVVIFAGTNDIAGNNGPQTSKMIENNLQAMTELAQGHGIKTVLCSVMPVADYGRAPMTKGRPPADIVKLNAWIKEYASRSKSGFVDYYAATADAKGLLREGISMDGLHPNAEGYKLMVPVVEAAIDAALK